MLLGPFSWQVGEAGPPVIPRGFDDWAAFATLRGRRLGDVTSQHETSDANDKSGQEQNAPTPPVERLGRHQRGDCRSDSRAKHDAKGCPAADYGAHQSTITNRRTLHEKDN